jgi:hypothetical protein
VSAKLERLANEVGASAAPRTIAVRDLLGNLRGASSATARLAALDRLVRADADPEVQRRAILVAAGDEASSVRARAVQLAAPTEADREEFCRVALADAAPLVRRFAVARTVELLAGASARLLVERLAVETDDALFVALDAALCRVVPGNEPHPLAGGDAAALQAGQCALGGVTAHDLGAGELAGVAHARVPAVALHLAARKRERRSMCELLERQDREQFAHAQRPKGRLFADSTRIKFPSEFGRRFC